MNATMSVDEYRKQVRDPAIARDRDDWEFGKELVKRGIGAKVQFRTGYAVIEGGKKVKEVNRPWQSFWPDRQHIEDDHTEMVAGYLEILLMQGKVMEYTHTANETWDPGWKQKAKNQAKGVRSGIPDFVIVFKHAVLFLELKKPVGGAVSKTQKVWIAALAAIGGAVHVEVAKGFDEAKKWIDEIVLEENAIA